MSADASVPSDTFVDTLTTEIVAAYVGKNPIQASELPNLIRSVRDALRSDAPAAAPAEPVIEKPNPAQIKKSVTPDAIISFIDGKSYKSMRRHLTTHGLNPDSYRQRYGLPVDYPMVCPNYSVQRSNLAKQLGLGQQRRNWPEQEAPEPAPAAPKRKKADPKVTDKAAA